MDIRRWSVVGLTAAMLVPGLAACKQPGAESNAGSSASPAASGTSGAIPGATASADAKQALLASTNEIGNGNFRFNLTSGTTTASGTVHKPSRSAELRSTLGGPGADLAMDLDLVYIEPDSWVKATFNGSAADSFPALKNYNGKYLHIDPTRAKGAQNLVFNFDQLDPAGSAALTKAVVDVHQTGTGQYAGTIDLTKATDAKMADQALVTALGAQANSLPFTATLDDQGRLNKLAIQVPATTKTKAQELTVTYSDYGAATAAQKPPAGETQEAPPELYQLFSSR
ncbi:hypothetical protein ACFFWC_06685 [Plantactinospora siamensis]|uniref:Lipoprotein n=1 Tax=Plantactinospora siamensis TaxID=555372 RepID=A0ABV6NWY1_9ACTN